MINKSDLRKKICLQRNALTIEHIQTASEKIFDRVIALPLFLNAKNIACYASHQNEVDTMLIMRHARQLKKNIYLPVMTGKNTLHFYLFDSHAQCVNNRLGIAEPVVTTIKNQQAISPDQLDLIFMPLVGFDAQGNRLGRGAGYYDRFLAFKKNKLQREKPVLIGLAYEFQQVPAIIPDSWDVAMDYVVTESALYGRDSDRL